MSTRCTYLTGRRPVPSSCRFEVKACSLSDRPGLSLHVNFPSPLWCPLPFTANPVPAASANESLGAEWNRCSSPARHRGEAFGRAGREHKSSRSYSSLHQRQRQRQEGGGFRTPPTLGGPPFGAGLHSQMRWLSLDTPETTLSCRAFRLRPLPNEQLLDAAEPDAVTENPSGPCKVLGFLKGPTWPDDSGQRKDGASLAVCHVDTGKAYFKKFLLNIRDIKNVFESFGNLGESDQEGHQ